MPDPPKNERAIFEAMLELSSAGERRAYLNGACGDDAELRERVEALVRAHEEAGGFLPEDDPYLAAAAGGKGRITSGLLPVTEKPGDRIGRYKLREKIGEGGCGVVYVAEQEEPVRRRVALKVIKLGMDTRSVIARFEAERQALAIMDHPNVAKVLDAGATETGRPYFVMELVRGIRITEYCDQHKLSTRERLDLFVKVCQAVQHAHQKGIIHRDIKPSNILVTLHDGVPVPKIIDFGIAKATEGRLTDLTVYTELNQFIGTPAYMSPEQAEMSGLDIDTRSDIYSLGVLLYELLTGQPPFDPGELLRRGLDEIRRTIREVEPPRPSTCLSTLAAASLSDVAHHRHTEAPKLLSLIRGDLDWIVMKCLEKDRTRRYNTANGLAADIQRHLKQEPVVARPPSATYRFQRLVRRNRFAVAAGGAVAAALVVGLAVSLVALARERAANARAERQRRLAEQRLLVAVRHVESFLTNDLRAVRTLPGSTRPMESMLHNTLAFMDALTPVRTDHPEFLLTSAKIHTELARLQGSPSGLSLGKPEAALSSASNAWSLLQAIPADALSATRRREITFAVEEASGMALQALGRKDEALEHYRRMLPLGAILDVESPRANDYLWSSEARIWLATLYQSKSQFDRDELDHLLRDPYLLTNTASDDLGRLRFTEIALAVSGRYYMGVSNWIAALDSHRQGLAFCEAYLKQSNADQLMEYHATLHLRDIGRAILRAQGNHVEAFRTGDEARRRLEALANHDKGNWIFQATLNSFRLGGAQVRIAVSKQAGLPLTERVRLLEEARDLFKRALDRMQTSSSSTGVTSQLRAKPGDIARELSELESELAALKASEK